MVFGNFFFNKLLHYTSKAYIRCGENGLKGCKMIKYVEFQKQHFFGVLSFTGNFVYVFDLVLVLLGIESLPQTRISPSLNLVNLRAKTLDCWSKRMYSLKYLRFTTLGWKDIKSRKSEFVAKTQDKKSFAVHYYTFCCTVRTGVSSHILPFEVWYK